MDPHRDIAPIVRDTPYLGCTVAAFSDVGCVREENQDFMGYFRLPAAQVLVVADGMGGHQGGFEASRIAVDAVRQELVSRPDAPAADVLADAIAKANAAIRVAASHDEGLTGMGSTIVILYVQDDQAWVAHVGDSRLYRLRGGVIEQLTVDHTRVNRMVEAGLIPAAEAAGHPMSHVLERALGVAPQVQGQVTPMRVEPGDSYLLCSDGLTDKVRDPEIARLMAQPAAQAARAAVDLALERGADDNTTVAVLRVQGAAPAPAPPAAPPPAHAQPADAPTSPVMWMLLGMLLMAALIALGWVGWTVWQEPVELPAPELQDPAPVAPDPAPVDPDPAPAEPEPELPEPELPEPEPATPAPTDPEPPAADPPAGG